MVSKLAGSCSRSLTGFLDSFKRTPHNKPNLPPSSSGLGCLVLSQKTPVRVRLGVLGHFAPFRMLPRLLAQARNRFAFPSIPATPRRSVRRVAAPDFARLL